jgi:triacylglycerol lipase
MARSTCGTARVRGSSSADGLCPTTRLALSALALVAFGCGNVEPLSSRLPKQLAPQAKPAPMDVSTGAVAVADDPQAKLGPPYPIVMVHGFSGWNDIGPLDYFFEVRDALVADGNDVTTPALPPYNTSDARAVVLAQAIDDVLVRTGKAKVHLIGHSQGGIDIRKVVASLGYGKAGKIASVTTVSTPHDGTAVADLASSAPSGLLNPAGQFLAWLLGVTGGSNPPTDLSGSNTSDNWTPDLAASIASLTPAAEEALVAHNPIPSNIPFFTVAGVSNLRSLHNAECAASLWGESDSRDDTTPFLAATGTYLSFTDNGSIDEPNPNDGLVTVKSAKALGSTFLGCVPADHFDEIGQIAELGPGLISGWYHVDFYKKLVAQVRTTEP